MSNIGPPPVHNGAHIPFLGVLDITALIINKVVGTGIFTAPVVVLLYTQEKWVALLLWFLGLIFTWGK